MNKLTIISVARDSISGAYWALARHRGQSGLRYRKLTRGQAAKLINIKPELFMVKVV